MPSRERLRSFTPAIALAALAVATPLAAAGPPAPVSPGDPRQETTVEVRCPTFSWAAPGGMTDVELAVYSIDESGQVSESPALARRLPAGSTAWTPPAESCLEAGARYAWSVRQGGAEKPGEWSAPALFRVDVPRQAMDLEEVARLVLRRLEGRSGSATFEALAAGGPSAVAALARLHQREAQEALAGEVGSSSSPGSLANFSPQKVGLSVEVGGEFETAYGLHGVQTTEGLFSAGVFGESSGGGLTAGLLGRHTGDGYAGLLSVGPGADFLAGIAELDETTYEYRFRITGDGDLYLADDLVASTVFAGTVAGDLECSGCIASDEVASRSLLGLDLGYDTISQREMGIASVGGEELDTISVVSVECNGECTDLTLGQACAVAGPARRPIAVDCEAVDHDTGSACGGDNVCSSFAFSVFTQLSAFCDDVSGWDAQVYCIDDDG